MVGAAKARSQLRGKNRVTDVNAPITVSGHTGPRFKARNVITQTTARRQGIRYCKPGHGLSVADSGRGVTQGAMAYRAERGLSASAPTGEGWTGGFFPMEVRPCGGQAVPPIPYG